MSSIAVAAEAGGDIVRRLASGELQIHGILLRDTISKKFRYILRGLEGFEPDKISLPEFPPLDPLRVAMSMQQLLQVATIAQNAAAAASLRRIEAKLAAIDRRLDGMEQRLGRLERNTCLVLEAMHAAPVSRLKAASNAAVTARRLNDTTALIGATQQAEQAARDLLAQALHLVRIEERGIPYALLCPTELADLVCSTSEAMLAASAMHLALGSGSAAARVMHEVADGIEEMRNTLQRRLSDPELMLRRLEIGLAPHPEIQSAAAALRDNQLWTRGRAVLIEAREVGAAADQIEFERITRPEGLSFLQLP